MPVVRLFTVTVATLALSGCLLSRDPDPELYALAPVTGADTPTSSGPLVGLSEITLPAYARNQQITTAVTAVNLVEDDDNRWAVPPTEAVTNAIAQSLEVELSGTVVVRPYPRGVAPQVRVQVSFDRLLRSQAGGADISGQYIVVGEGDALRVERFALEIGSTTDGYAAYMEAMTRALEALSAQIADDVADVAG